MKRTKLIRLVGLVLSMALVLLAIGLSIVGDAGYTFVRTVPIALGARVRIDGGAALIRGGGRPGEVVVGGKVHLWSLRASQAEAERRVELTSTPTELLLKVDQRGFILFPLLVSLAKVELTVTVPDGTEVLPGDGPQVVGKR